MNERARTAVGEVITLVTTRLFSSLELQAMNLMADQLARRRYTQFGRRSGGPRHGFPNLAKLTSYSANQKVDRFAGL
jgi:hypothetical protein